MYRGKAANCGFCRFRGLQAARRELFNKAGEAPSPACSSCEFTPRFLWPGLQCLSLGRWPLPLHGQRHLPCVSTQDTDSSPCTRADPLCISRGP